ncbi:MAG: regulatory protein TetR [Klenkia sp.]|nr:regulatory protein TetR [Klenkia sp.]
MDPVSGDVKRRRYASTLRADRAAATRRAVLEAARALFLEQGYVATSVAAIAGRAGVAVDTVYASTGRKPAIMAHLVETALSGTEDAVPGPERDYVDRIRSADGARAKLGVYAVAVAALGERLAPVHRALAEAAVTDPDCAALQNTVATRRRANMLLLAADLRATGELRPDMDDDDVADVVWATNSAEFQALLVGGRGWTTQRFGDWLADSWARLLLS